MGKTADVEKETQFPTWLFLNPFSNHLTLIVVSKIIVLNILMRCPVLHMTLD